MLPKLSEVLLEESDIVFQAVVGEVSSAQRWSDALESTEFWKLAVRIYSALPDVLEDARNELLSVS